MGIVDNIRTGLLRWLIRAKIAKLVPYGSYNNLLRNWTFDDFVKDGYKRNPPVYTCCQKLGKALAAVKIGIEKDGEVLTPNDYKSAGVEPLAKLIRRFNTNQSDAEFKQLWVNHMYLAGVSFIQGYGVGSRTIGGVKRPMTAPELYLVKPDCVEVKLENNGRTIAQYIVEDAEGKKYPLTPDEMYHTIFADPANEMKGLSPLTAASYSIDTANEVLVWNYGLLKNSAVPSGILRVLGWAAMGKSERTRLSDEFSDFGAGSANAGKVIPMDGQNAEFVSLAHSPKDMDWLNTKAMTLREVCECMGVPSVLVGDTENSTYNNMETAERVFYENTVLPLHEHFLTELSEYLLPRMGYEAIRLVSDTSGISALQENEAEIVLSLSKADWMTPNEKRARMPQPLEPHDSELADELYLRMPGSLKPVQPDEVDAEESEEPEEQRQVRTIPFPGSRFPTLEAREKRIDERNKQREPWEADYKRDLDKYWNGQLERVLSNIRTAKRADALPDPFIIDEEAKYYAGQLEATQQGLVIHFGNDAMRELVTTGVFKSDPSINDWMAENLVERSKLINETTLNDVKAILIETQTEGYNVTSKAIRDYYGELPKYRADAISRTEVGRAQVYATKQGYRQSEQILGTRVREEWITARDSHVRGGGKDIYDHVVMDGRLTNDAGLFVTDQVGEVSGPMMEGPAGWVINCRCDIAPITTNEPL